MGFPLNAEEVKRPVEIITTINMKKYFPRLLIPLYLVGLVFILLIILKPGASIFYHKQTIDNAEAVTDSGYAYRYAIDLPAWLLQPERVLVLEDGEFLERTTPDRVADGGDGQYAVGGPLDGRYYLYFSPRGLQDVRTSTASFTILTPTWLVSRPLGIIYLCILCLGLVGFLAYAMFDPARRRTLLISPLSVYDSFVSRGIQLIRACLAFSRSTVQVKFPAWKRLLTLTILSAYAYVFMEWLFFVTKPSFMSMITPAERSGLLLLSGLAFAMLGIGLLLVSQILDVFLVVLSPKFITIYTGAVIPAGIWAAISLILFDNFTYTLFGFGIVSSDNLGRAVYALGLIILFGYFTVRVSRFIRHPADRKSQKRLLFYLSRLSVGLVCISLLVAGLSLGMKWAQESVESAQAGGASAVTQHPNILLLGGDGLDATSLSVYGYERDTTPNLRRLAPTSLLAENAFSNAAHSAGSVLSIFTSKTPYQTHVLYPPDILTGLDAYQHLPRLLRQAGYHTVEIGIPYYMDAFDMNVQDGFDLVNGKRGEGWLASQARRLGFGEDIYFTKQLVERFSDRLLHITFIRQMVNPFTQVTLPDDSSTDRKRLEQLLDLINSAEQPFFVHVHLMNTHGPIFDPDQQTFSANQIQTGEWMTDFYDDSILQFDRSVGQVLEALEQAGIYEETILLIYSDHPQQYDVAKRIPLIIHFPGGDYAGRIQSNVQNLDIAPTLLDYLGLEQPTWMNGQSLLNGEPPQDRPVFSGSALRRLSEDGTRYIIDPARDQPPFYQFAQLTLVQCNRWYQFDILTGVWDSNRVLGHTAPCPEESLPSLEQARAALAEYIAHYGLDGSALP